MAEVLLLKTMPYCSAKGCYNATWKQLPTFKSFHQYVYTVHICPFVSVVSFSCRRSMRLCQQFAALLTTFFTTDF